MRADIFHWLFEFFTLVWAEAERYLCQKSRSYDSGFVRWLTNMVWEIQKTVTFYDVQLEAGQFAVEFPMIRSWFHCCLCIVLINDINLHLKRSEIILYADDTVIYYANKNIWKQLNSDLEQIANWFIWPKIILKYLKPNKHQRCNSTPFHSSILFNLFILCAN